jgi:hypothetical protein
LVLFGTNDVICNRNHYKRQGQKTNFLRYLEIWFISFIYANSGARTERSEVGSQRSDDQRTEGRRQTTGDGCQA